MDSKGCWSHDARSGCAAGRRRVAPRSADRAAGAARIDPRRLARGVFGTRAAIADARRLQIVSINAAELGSTTRFNFGVVVVTGITNDPQGNPDFTNAQLDLAPDAGHGLWNYTVRVAPLRLLARSFSLNPRPPRAGRALTARLVAARSDTGAVVTGGRVVCNATVGGRRIAGSGRFVGREARCIWRVPGSARGARIRGSIAVVFEGRRVTRSFSATVG